MSSIAFTHPGFLWFCMLAVLPPLIHLLGLRKPRKLRFPPFEFVLRSERMLRTKRRLRSIILLLLRTLLLLLIPIALAGPHTAPPPSAGGFSLDVVILDNSMSAMQISGGEPALEKMKRFASGVASRAAPSNRFVLVTTSEPPRLVTPFPLSSPVLAEAAVHSVTATYTATSLGGAASIARTAVEGASPTSVRGYLVGDLAAHGWHEGEDLSMAASGGRAPFEIFDGAPEPGNNLSPSAVEVHSIRNGAVMSVAVSNHSAAPWRASVHLDISGLRISDKGADIPARGEGSVSFELENANRGVIAGSATTGPDSLVQDNTLFFARRAGGTVSVLILNGDPRPVKLADEAFYLDSALKAGDAESFRTWVAFPDVLPEDLGRFDAIAMLNCGTVPPATWAAVDSFVKNGGGLLVAAGDRTDGGALGGLGWLPARLMGPPVSEPGSGIAILAGGHPAMEPFAGDENGLEGVRISKRFELQPVQSSTTILSTKSGRPLLVVGSHGKGRVAVFGSTMDRDWNDWPIRASYLPAARALFKFLAGDDSGARIIEMVIGERKELQVDSCPVRLQRRPGIAPEKSFPAVSGNAAEMTPTDRIPCTPGKEKGAATVSSPNTPGIYELRTAAGKSADIVVRTAPSESDLAKIPRRDLENALGFSKKSAIGSMIGMPAAGQEGFSPTSYILLLAMILLAAEQWLTRRG